MQDDAQTTCLNASVSIHTFLWTRPGFDVPSQRQILDISAQSSLVNISIEPLLVPGSSSRPGEFDGRFHHLRSEHVEPSAVLPIVATQRRARSRPNCNRQENRAYWKYTGRYLKFGDGAGHEPKSQKPPKARPHIRTRATLVIMMKLQRPSRPRVHSGPVNAMFDDVDDLLRGDAAIENPQQPPPPFVVAGSAIATAAALTLTNANAAATAASVRSVPAYQPPLRQRIAGFYERHTQLTKTLEDLGDIPAQIDATQHDIFAVTGKVKSQEARLKTLQAISREMRDTHAKMGSSLTKRLMNKRGRRARLVVQAHDDAEKAAIQQAAHEAELDQSRSVLASKIQRKAELERDLIEFAAVSNEIDKIDTTLFDGATPEFAQDDLAEWEVKVWLQVQVFMAAETNREKRARQMLKDAIPILASIIKDVQAALQHCIDSGVATNQKYTKNLISNTTSKSTVSATQPLVLRAKTSSGKFFTTIAKARGSQMLVTRPPEFRLIELYLMPGSKNPKSVNEKGLHKSLETSYAQAKALDSYLKREIAASLERQKKLSVETAKLQDTVKGARRHLRDVRRRIMVSVVTEDRNEEKAKKETHPSTNHVEAGHDSQVEEQPSLEDRTFALPLQDAANPMISTHLQENLRREALARLRTLVALPEPESDDDNLYPVLA